jgi:hypothetical protein
MDEPKHTFIDISPGVKITQNEYIELKRWKNLCKLFIESERYLFKDVQYQFCTVYTCDSVRGCSKSEPKKKWYIGCNSMHCCWFCEKSYCNSHIYKVVEKNCVSPPIRWCCNKCLPETVNNFKEFLDDNNV